MALAVVVAVVVVAVVIVLALQNSGTEQGEPTAEPTAPVVTTEPTTAETTSGSQEPTSSAETGGATSAEELSEQLNTNGVVLLDADEPAIVAADEPVDGLLVPVGEVRLLDVVRDWQPTATDGLPCDDPEHGQFLGLQVEVSVLPDAVAPARVGGLGWYPGANGTIVEDNSATWNPTLGCLAAEDRLPTEMVPGQTYTGWLVMDAPVDVEDVIYAGWTDLDHTWFVWRLSDY